MKNEVLIDVKHLTHLFQLTKKMKVRAVDDISFQIRKGEIFGLVGESGSGKSTVARCLMNIYQPQRGRSGIMMSMSVIKKRHEKIKRCCRPDGR